MSAQVGIACILLAMGVGVWAKVVHADADAFVIVLIISLIWAGLCCLIYVVLQLSLANESARAREASSALPEALLAERYQLSSKELTGFLTPDESSRLLQLETQLSQYNAREAAAVDYAQADRLDAALDKLEAYLATLTTKPH